ncbi:unnamed protein product [Urochloa humidicola]
MAEENLPTQKTSIRDIFNDTLELILLRVTSPVVLIRAAATCKLWRRVIGDAGFLHRFRRRNGPYVLGCHLYDNYGHCKDFVEFPAPVREMGIDISDHVSLSFLPSYPVLHDSRGGLLAFSSNSASRIIVCNPWTRETRELFYPTMLAAGETILETQEILGAFFLDANLGETEEILGAFFLDAGPGETATDISNFRILCVQLRLCHDDGSKTVQACVFSARDNLWLQLDTMVIGDSPSRAPFYFVGRVGGSICWSYKTVDNDVLLLHLDESTGEFSCFTAFTLPAGVNRRHQLRYDRLSLRLVGGNTGSVRLLRIASDDLEVLCHDRSSGTCVVERRVPLFRIAGGDDLEMLCHDRSAVERRVRFSPVASNEHEAKQQQYGRRWERWCFSDDTSDEEAAPGRIVLCDNHCEVEYVWMFSVHTQTIELQRIRKLSADSGRRTFPYELPWTISACL